MGGKRPSQPIKGKSGFFDYPAFAIQRGDCIRGLYHCGIEKEAPAKTYLAPGYFRALGIARIRRSAISTVIDWFWTVLGSFFAQLGRSDMLDRLPIQGAPADGR
jgi:hypothetical protein